MSKNKLSCLAIVTIVLIQALLLNGDSKKTEDLVPRRAPVILHLLRVRSNNTNPRIWRRSQ